MKRFKAGRGLGQTIAAVGAGVVFGTATALPLASGADTGRDVARPAAAAHQLSPSLPVTSGPGPAAVLAPVLQSLVDTHLIAGATALVADNEKVLEVDAVGYASLADKTPMRADDLFWLASMTKSFTAAGLMMLVDEGKVNIDDPVEKYLPEFKGQKLVAEKGEEPRPPKHPITVKEILSHTSGLVRASDPAAKNTYSLKDNVARIAAAPLQREPGTKYEYNNCGIDTAGRIIEVVSGQSYADFMQSRLFDPLGLKDTTFWPTEEQANRLAHSARFADDSKTNLEEVKLDKNLTQATIDRLRHGMTVPPAMIYEMGVGTITAYVQHFAHPAGGLYSTAADVGTFCQMLLNRGMHHGRRLLSEQSVERMTSSETGEVIVGPREGYGLGMSVKLKDDEGLRAGAFGHRGARRPVMWVDPKSHLAIVLLVERFDMPGEQQKVMYGSFLKAAEETYGTAGK